MHHNFQVSLNPIQIFGLTGGAKLGNLGCCAGHAALHPRLGEAGDDVNGAALAQAANHSAVVVTINYRLHTFLMGIL